MGKMETALKVNSPFAMDENVLAHRERAMRMLERGNRVEARDQRSAGYHLHLRRSAPSWL